MEEIYTNIYQESRKKAKLEQFEAADKIGVSYHTLQKYERKINPIIPHDDIVRNMVIAYNDRNLAYKHIKASALGEFLPDFQDDWSLSIAALTMLNDFKDMQEILVKIVEITHDGKIDASETSDWTEIQKIGNKLMQSLNALLNSKGDNVHVD